MFRWAWQHTGDSRHAKLDEDKAAHVAINPKTGKPKPRARRTARSLTAHLSNLHLLLRSTYFSGWPLKVRFFRADVYRIWNLWNERVDGDLPDNIIVIPDGDCGSQNGPRGEDCVDNVLNIKADYSKIQDYLEKATFLLDDSQGLRCKVCEAQVIPMNELVLVCPQMNCHGIAHLLCLSEKTLNATENPDEFVPTHAICPACKENVAWPLMMQELTLRCRGEKELRSILRKKKKRDNKNSNDGSGEANTDPVVNKAHSPAQSRPTVSPAKETSLPTGGQHFDENDREDSPLDEGWLEDLEVGSDSDAGDRLGTRSKPNPPRTEIIIEDSDED